MTEPMTLCNVCGRPLPVKSVWYESLDPDFSEWVDLTETYRTKEWDTRDIFPDLCESCACSIDKALRKMKNGMMEREKVLTRFKELNEERKKQLGTEG